MELILLIKNKLQTKYELEISRQTMMKYRQQLRFLLLSNEKRCKEVHIIFYTKEICSLCDDAEMLLELLEPEFPHTIEKRDIYSNEEWLKEYQLLIPVIEVNKEQLHVEEINYDRVKELLNKHKTRD